MSMPELSAKAFTCSPHAKRKHPQVILIQAVHKYGGTMSLTSSLGWSMNTPTTSGFVVASVARSCCAHAIATIDKNACMAWPDIQLTFWRCSWLRRLLTSIPLCCRGVLHVGRRVKFDWSVDSTKLAHSADDLTGSIYTHASPKDVQHARKICLR